MSSTEQTRDVVFMGLPRVLGNINTQREKD